MPTFGADMADEQRRSFLKWCVHGMGALVGAILGIPAIAYLIDARNRPARVSGMRKVEGIKISELQRNTPQQGVIRNVRQDAWTYHPNDVIGRVWVVKDDKGELRVFTTICPHLGCSINVGENGFACPCHGATFRRDGERVDPSSNPSKRGMDSLEFALAADPTNPDPKNRDLLLVEYVNYQQSKAEKIPRI
jgi:quinol---cytochrome c reductase iron-sulfur subunit, bacillus type